MTLAVVLLALVLLIVAAYRGYSVILFAPLAALLAVLLTDPAATPAVFTGLFMERVRRQDGRHPTPEQALLWATRHGYQAVGIADGGWLAPGNKADLIMVDLRKAHLVPVLRVVSDFVHQGQASDVEAVMVDGRWLMRDGTILTMDEAAIVRAADRIARAAWQRLFAARPDLTPPPGFDTAIHGTDPVQ